MKRSLAALAAVTAVVCFGQTDPGPRPGPPGAGSYYPNLSNAEISIFTQAVARFGEVDSVSGTIESGVGLGPGYNANSCAACHAQPAIGGSSPGLRSPQKPIGNPQVPLATLDGAHNTIPPFIMPDGPVREARFVSDGGVHDLFTIAGRTDAPGCNLAQPDFQQALAANNVIFRIPTPMFGLGLVEATPDSALQAGLAANQTLKTSLGIAGVFNTSGNDGTITRFGWKAQNKSLLIFDGEAYNVEQGVSNELFPNERNAVAGCVFNASPEDSTNIFLGGNASVAGSDVVNFALFGRMSAAPVPTTASPSDLNGQALFSSIGCVLCHTATLTTGSAIYSGMSNVAYHPYSDFALHNMGPVLTDGITQGAAGPSEWRTAPLWGLGQRLFFLHDGRTPDLMQAIQAHQSSGSSCTTPVPRGAAPPLPPQPPPDATTSCVSEANGVITQFNALTNSQKQDVLNFLRSL